MLVESAIWKLSEFLGGATIRVDYDPDHRDREWWVFANGVRLAEASNVRAALRQAKKEARRQLFEVAQDVARQKANGTSV